MSGDPNAASVRARLREFVLATTEQANAVVHDDTPLFEGGLLRSIHIMDLILLVEELSGATVDVEHLEPGAFRDVDTIMRAFFQAAPASAEGEGGR